MIVQEVLSALSLGDVVGGSNNPNKVLDSLWRKNYGRVLTAAGLSTTAAGAASDSWLEFFEDTNSLGKLPNIGVDSIIQLDDLTGFEGYIPSKHKFAIECVDAFPNTAYLSLHFLEHRPGESLIGKAKGAEVTLLENLGTMTLNQGSGMEQTKELGYHMVDEEFDRFVTHAAFLGSSAIADSKIDFTVDGDFRGNMYNITSIAVTIGRNNWLPANIYIPRGSTFDVGCTNAFAADGYLGLKICKLIPTPNAARVEASKPEKVA